MTSIETGERARAGATPGPATRRTAVVIWWVLLAAALGLTALAAAVGPGIWPRVGNRGNAVAWVLLAAAPACLFASWVLPRRIAPLATGESIAVGRSVVATAFNASSALLAPLGWMVSGSWVALVALAISVFGLLLVMPSQRRWQKLAVAQLSATSREPAAPARLSRPLPASWGRPIALLLVIVLIAAAALLVLSGILIWNELIGRPSSPLVQELSFLLLALLMTGFAIMRFFRASASRHPRWQRAWGVLLLFLACYAFGLFVRML